jgi:hypothetical protein
LSSGGSGPGAGSAEVVAPGRGVGQTELQLVPRGAPAAPGLLETVSTGVPTALATGTLGFATRTDLGKRISAATGGAIDVADLAFFAACAQRLTGAEPDLLRGANDEVIHGMMSVYAFHGGQYLGDAVGGYEARHRPADAATAGDLKEQAQVSVSVKTRS